MVKTEVRGLQIRMYLFRCHLQGQPYLLDRPRRADPIRATVTLMFEKNVKHPSPKNIRGRRHTKKFMRDKLLSQTKYELR